MRCTVCGCDILPNSICCQNCGTRVIEMTGVNSAQPRYGNSFNNSFNNGFDNGLNSNVRAVGKNMSIGKKVLILCRRNNGYSYRETVCHLHEGQFEKSVWKQL